MSRCLSPVLSVEEGREGVGDLLLRADSGILALDHDEEELLALLACVLGLITISPLVKHFSLTQGCVRQYATPNRIQARWK